MCLKHWNVLEWLSGLLNKTINAIYHIKLKSAHHKTHLIHRPIDICATSPLRLIEGTLSFLSLGGWKVRPWEGLNLTHLLALRSSKGETVYFSLYDFEKCEDDSKPQDSATLMTLMLVCCRRFLALRKRRSL